MSGKTTKEMEFIELVEKSYLKQKRDFFIKTGVLLGMVIGVLLALIIIFIV